MQIPDIQNSAHLIAEAIAAGRVRRFDAGDGADLLKLQHFLRQRGYVLHVSKNSYSIKREGQPSKPKAMHWSKVIDFIDNIRVGEGLQPLRIDHRPKSIKVVA